MLSWAAHFHEQIYETQSQSWTRGPLPPEVGLTEMRNWEGYYSLQNLESLTWIRFDQSIIIVILSFRYPSPMRTDSPWEFTILAFNQSPMKTDRPWKFISTSKRKRIGPSLKNSPLFLAFDWSPVNRPSVRIHDFDVRPISHVNGLRPWVFSILALDPSPLDLLLFLVLDQSPWDST